LGVKLKFQTCGKETREGERNSYVRERKGGQVAVGGRATGLVWWRADLRAVGVGRSEGEKRVSTEMGKNEGGVMSIRFQLGREQPTRGSVRSGS